MKKEELRVIPVKNYIILGVVILVSMILLYYFRMWIINYNENKLNVPILNKYMEVINYNELDNYFVENPDTILYVSVLENNEIRDFEKKFKNAFKNKKLNKDLIYLDFTNEIDNESILDEIKKKYTINSVSIKDVPVIMVIDGGVLKEIYSIKDNGYDIKKVIEFINNIRFSSEEEIDG